MTATTMPPTPRPPPTMPMPRRSSTLPLARWLPRSMAGPLQTAFHKSRAAHGCRDILGMPFARLRLPTIGGCNAHTHYRPRARRCAERPGSRPEDGQRRGLIHEAACPGEPLGDLRRQDRRVEGAEPGREEVRPEDGRRPLEDAGRPARAGEEEGRGPAAGRQYEGHGADEGNGAQVRRRVRQEL